MATVKELREQAKALNIKGYSKLTKAQLEELIRKHNQAAQEQQETPAEAAYRKWTEDFKGKDTFAFYSSRDYLEILDTIANSGEIVAEKVDTYIPHWYIESGRADNEFRHALFHTDPRRLVKFLALSSCEDFEDRMNSIRVAIGLATVESVSWKWGVFQRQVSKLVASLETVEDTDNNNATQPASSAPVISTPETTEQQKQADKEIPAFFARFVGFTTKEIATYFRAFKMSQLKNFALQLIIPSYSSMRKNEIAYAIASKITDILHELQATQPIIETVDYSVQQETPAETAPVISTDTQAVNTPEPSETTPADIQNADKFSVGSGKNTKNYHITTRRLASPYLNRLFGLLIDVCNSDNNVIASFSPSWHEDFVFNAKYTLNTSTKSAIKRAFMKNLPLFLKKTNLSDNAGRILSDGNEDLRNAVDQWCNTWGHNIGNFPIYEYDRKHQPVPVQEAKPETHAHPELQPLSAEWDLLHAKFAGECTDIEIIRGKIRLANTCINLKTVRAYQEAHSQPVPAQAVAPMTPAEEKHEIHKQFCNCEMSPDEFRAMLNGFSMDGINNYLNHLIYFYRPENFTHRNAVDFLIESYIPIWEKDQARIKAYEAYQAKRAEEKSSTAAVITPAHDMAFDETAYSPDVQDITVNVDDIPADHEPDIAPTAELFAAPDFFSFTAGKTYRTGKYSDPVAYFIIRRNGDYITYVRADGTGEAKRRKVKTQLFIFPSGKCYNTETINDGTEREGRYIYACHLVSAKPETPKPQPAQRKKVCFEIGKTYGHKFSLLGSKPLFITILDRNGDTATVATNRSDEPQTLDIHDWGDFAKEALYIKLVGDPHDYIIDSTSRPTPDDEFDLHYYPTTYAGQWLDVTTDPFDRKHRIKPIWGRSDMKDYMEYIYHSHRRDKELDINGAIITYAGSWTYLDPKAIEKGIVKPSKIYALDDTAYKAWRKSRHAKKKPAAVQPAPAPETKAPRHVKKIDDSRQFLICFDNAETPANIQPAKPKPRRRPRPRIKRDYTRQILIDFGEDIPSGKTNQRQAA